MTGLFVLTCPRATDDRWAYIKALVAHVESEKVRCQKWIVVDGTDDDARELGDLLPDGWALERYPRPPAGTFLGGNKWPYWKLLEVARDATSINDDALVLEDDLAFCHNAVQRMLILPTPIDVDVMQFFSAWLFRADVRDPYPGLWRTPADVQGCQAIKYPRRTLELLVEWAKVPEWIKYNESDVAMGLAKQRLGLRWANHIPDLVQHSGHVSRVGHGMLEEAGITDAAHHDAASKSLKGRVSVNWPGEAFDAMKLFARPDLYR